MTPAADTSGNTQRVHVATYESSGVSIAAGDRAVQLMKASVARATRPEVVGGIGGFAGLFDLTPYTRFRKPLLAAATDGVGTKVDIARRMDVHDTIGIDLVAMVLDDLVVCGAEPLFLTDYIATGKVVPERIAAIVSGIAEGCRRAGAALIGGETAEHPGLLDDDEYDVAGAGTGIVDADDVLAERVQVGDVLVGMGSSGLHSNGFSLARHILFDLAGWSLDKDVEQLGRTLGEELLEPDSHLQPGLPGACRGSALRRSCVVAHHRWRVGRQCGSRAAVRCRCVDRPFDVDPTADFRPAS